jgi:putative ABC transport system permease protein
VRAAHALVAAAARLAPRGIRADFRREWEAELAWAATVPRRRRTLARHTLGAFAHALWLRRQQWRIDMLWQDLKYAWRVLAGQPAFTAVAALTLALGIGANAAIFSIVDAVLLKPLPFHEPERLVQIWETNPLRNWTAATASPANLMDWKRQNTSFEDIAFYPGMDDRTPMVSGWTLTGGGAEPQRVTRLGVSTNFMRVLGVQPALGRDFRDDEQNAGQHRVAILSHAFWQSRFASDPSIVGRAIEINGFAYQVVGVMPGSFTFPDPAVQMWTPQVVNAGFLAQRRPHYLRPIARLKPGVGIAQARQDLQAIATRLEREYPDTNTQMGVDLGPLRDWVVGDVRLALLLFLSAVGLVLLIACANLANLLLARAAGRTRELAVRAALGADGWRIARQMLTENLLLAAAGGALGIAVARWALAAIVAASPAELPRLTEVVLDWRVVAFVLGLTAAATLLIGALPALAGARAGSSPLRDGARTTSAGRRTRRALVVAQIAASVALVVCAGLLLRSFMRLQAVEPGFHTEGVVTFRVSLTGVKYSDDAPVIQFWESLLARIRALPGVQAAGASTVIGLEGQGWTGDLFVDGRPDFHARQLRHKDVTPGYFAAMGLPVLRGRDVADSDTAGAPPVAVVNQSFVQAYFANEDPIGRRISYSYNPQQRAWRTIVGVVADEKQDSLAKPVAPEVYESHRQNPTSGMTVVVRASAQAASVVPSLRAEVRALDAGLALFDVRTLDEVVAASVARERFTAWLVTLFAALALTIAAIGVYGVVAYSVSRRTREIGVRMALGADRAGVLWLVFRETLLLVGVGLAGGFVAAGLAARAIRSLLFQTSAADAVTYASVAIVLGVVALLASYLPARRAVAVDPATALRCE